MPEKDNRPVKVEVKNLTKRFGDLLVLDDMSFNIRKGEFVCVVGPTGCGKSTFLNCLTRIHQPSSGDIYIDGVPADPREAQHLLCVPGTQRPAMADGGAEHRLRPEDQKGAKR